MLSAYAPHRSHPTSSSPTNDYLFGVASPETSTVNILAMACNYYQSGPFYVSTFGNPTEDVVGSVTVNANTPLKLRLKWDPTYDGKDDPPPAPPSAPDHVDLLVTTYMVAGVDIRNAPPVGGAVIGSVGRSGAATASIPRFGESVSFPLADLDGETHRSGSLTGHHLVRVGVNGGIAEFTLDAQGQAQASSPVHSAGAEPVVSPSYVEADAQAQAWAHLDDRAVTISANVDPTSYKDHINGGYSDEWGDPIYVAKAHTPDPDGTMYGDIGIGYGDASSNSTSNYSQITYHASLTGDWSIINSQYNWFSSLKQSGASGTVGSPSDTLDDFTNLYLKALSVSPSTNRGLPTINPGETGNTDHIHLTVTDGDYNSDGSYGSDDHASGTANYYMTLHQPEEFHPSNKHSVLRSGLPQDFYYQDVSVSPADPGYAFAGGGIACTWNEPGAYWDWASSGLSVLGASTPVIWLNAFLTAAGIGVDKLKPQEDSGVANFDDAWNYPDSTFPSDYPRGYAPQSFYHMVPQLHSLYKMHYTMKDHYDVGGYEGTTRISSSEYINGAGQWYGNFVYAPPTTP